MKVITKNPNDWRNDRPTQAQLDYIKHIWEESEWPLKPFTGKTKGEAADWINKNRYYVCHSILGYDETHDDWGDHR